MSTDLEQRLREALLEDADRARLINPDGPPAPHPQSLSTTEPSRPSTRRVVAVAAAGVLIAVAVIAVMQNRDQEAQGPLTPGPTASDPEDQAIADKAVLKLDEHIAFGWEAAPPDVEEQWRTDQSELDQAVADCLDIDVSEVQHDGPTAASTFVNPLEPNDELVTAKVTVLPSESEAKEVVARLRGEARQGCYLSALEEQIAEGARDGITTITGRVLSGDDIAIGDSTMTNLYLEYLSGGSYRRIGGTSIGFRVEVPLSSEGVEVPVYAVVVFSAKGRALVETSFQTYFSPYDGGPSTNAVAPQRAMLLTHLILNRV